MNKNGVKMVISICTYESFSFFFEKSFNIYREIMKYKIYLNMTFFELKYSIYIFFKTLFTKIKKDSIIQSIKHPTLYKG